MPKRGGGRMVFNGPSTSGSRYSSLRDYHTGEHDDRDRERPKERNNTRRVSFKPPQLPSRAMKGRMGEIASRYRAEDDEDMDGLTKPMYGDRLPRRKGSPIPKGKFGNNQKLLQNTFGWYQVIVKGGQRFTKDEVLRALIQAISPDIFIPHYWRTDKHEVVFFVDDFKSAERLQSVERSVQMSDGYRLLVRVRSGCPIVSVDEQFKERMKVVMAKRYNPQTRALDLSKFHTDSDFKDMFCALFRPPVMTAALDIIEKNIPELEALNLNENHISTMEAFKNVAKRLPNLKILYLGDNKIPSLAHLMALRSVPLIELVLKQNPLRLRYKDQALYVSEVRRKFPKLQKLDGEELQPLILFDVNESSALPPPKASYLCDAAGTEIIRQFMEQYFHILDSDNRQPLLDAYHEQALMSISIPPASQAGRLASFWKFNRNFRRVVPHEDHNTFRQLKFGRLAVVSTLAEWPKTQHDPQSFSVDMTLFTPKIICFTIAGLFKEYELATSTTGDVRYFQRQLVIVPAGSGFCIRNEMILITGATNAQIRSFQRGPNASVTSVTDPGPSTSSVQSRLQQHQQQNIAMPNLQPALAGLSITAPDDTTKLQMVQMLSTQSLMNLEWSRKCLEETNWDYNHATFVFEKLQKENKIPPEAFVK